MSTPPSHRPSRHGSDDAPLEALDRALHRLHVLCEPSRGVDVADLRQRLASGTVRILLVGEAKRGKSTLGNALLGREILPTGVTPVTAIATVVSSGRPERVDVRYRDGRTDTLPLAALADYVTERGNPDNTRGVESVTAVVDTGMPVPGVTVVDTPGVGSVHAHNTSEARAALERMDLAVLVITADPPMSASEADLLAEVGARAVATFVVLNKSDRLAPSELDETLDFLRAVRPGIDVLPCSARAGLEARLSGDEAAYRSSGVAAVVDAVTDRVSARGTHDLATSIAGSAHRVAAALADETTLTLAALAARAEMRQEQVEAFRRHLSGLPAAAAEAHARVSWRLRQLRLSLTDDAATRCADLTRQTRAEIDRLIRSTDQAGRGGRDVDRLRADGECALERIVREDIDDWRTAWADRLADHTTRIVTDEDHELARTAQQVRDAAAQDLDVELNVPAMSLPHSPQTRFGFDFTEPVGWEAPFADQVRAHAPGRLAQRRTETALRRRAVQLPDKHLGRARHDLDEILREVERTLPAQIQRAYAELGDGLHRAVDAATAASARTAREVQTERDRLISRRAELADLMGTFGGIRVPA